MNLLQEADRLTSGERAADYGEVLRAARDFAAIASACTGLDIRPEHFPLIMQALKLSRIAQAPECWNADSWRDVAGWARVAEMYHEQVAAESG